VVTHRLRPPRQPVCLRFRTLQLTGRSRGIRPRRLCARMRRRRRTRGLVALRRDEDIADLSVRLSAAPRIVIDRLPKASHNISLGRTARRLPPQSPGVRRRVPRHRAARSAPGPLTLAAAVPHGQIRSRERCRRWRCALPRARRLAVQWAAHTTGARAGCGEDLLQELTLAAIRLCQTVALTTRQVWRGTPRVPAVVSG
jgi:hypothetical protein